jgi:hypothetical protein
MFEPSLFVQPYITVVVPPTFVRLISVPVAPRTFAASA